MSKHLQFFFFHNYLPKPFATVGFTTKKPLDIVAQKQNQRTKIIFPWFHLYCKNFLPLKSHLSSCILHRAQSGFDTKHNQLRNFHQMLPSLAKLCLGYLSPAYHYDTKIIPPNTNYVNIFLSFLPLNFFFTTFFYVKNSGVIL